MLRNKCMKQSSRSIHELRAWLTCYLALYVIYTEILLAAVSLWFKSPLPNCWVLLKFAIQPASFLSSYLIYIYRCGMLHALWKSLLLTRLYYTRGKVNGNRGNAWTWRPNSTSLPVHKLLINVKTVKKARILYQRKPCVFFVHKLSDATARSDTSS